MPHLPFCENIAEAIKQSLPYSRIHSLIARQIKPIAKALKHHADRLSDFEEVKVLLKRGREYFGAKNMRSL